MSSKSSKKMKVKAEPTTVQAPAISPFTSSGGSIEPRLRPMACEQRRLHQPDGSASFQQGSTSVLAAVYGPSEVRMARELADRATLDIVYKPKVGTPDLAARALERLIRGAIDGSLLSMLHPRTSFTIVVQELQDGGSIVACCINAVCAALLDACAPMSCTFAAVHACIDADGRLAVDPDAKTSEGAVAEATFVFESKDARVVAVSSSGAVSDEQFQTSLSACRMASQEIFALYRESYSKRAAVI